MRYASQMAEGLAKRIKTCLATGDGEAADFRSDPFRSDS